MIAGLPDAVYPNGPKPITLAAQSTALYTEQNIRGLAINFLRQHYKLRPRMGATGTRVITKVHYYKGVTIDARLSYQQPDGTWFMATVEATSRDRAQEVLYRVNWFRIAVHAFLIALLALVLTLGVAQLSKASLFEYFGRPNVYAFLISGFVSVWTGAGILLSRLEYYRYIYAVAQFMRFHADAQWIAYDRTIFFAPLEGNVSNRKAKRYARRMRRYYEELQRQCILFGFGLMEIREDNVVRWLIEPSHIDQFGGERGRLPKWMEAIQAPPVIARLGGSLPFGKTSPAPAPAPEKFDPADVPAEAADPLAVGNYLPRKVREVDYQEKIVPVAKKRLPWYRQPARAGSRIRWRARRIARDLYPREWRERPGYYELPAWVLSTALALLLGAGILLYQQARWEPLARPGQKRAAPALTPLEPAPGPRASDEQPGVLPGEYDPGLTAREFARNNDRATAPPEVVNSQVGTNQGISVLEIGENHIARAHYDCLALYLAQGTLYLIVEGRYTDYATAVERAEFLNDRFEVRVGVTAGSCLDPLADDYVLFVGGVQVTEGLTNQTLRRLRGELGIELRVVSFE